MKKFILILSVLAISLLSAQDPVAVITKIKGDIEIKRAEKNVECVAGTVLFNQDEISSSDNSYAALKFTDGGGLLKIFPNSHLTVKAERAGKELKKNSYLSRGNVFAKVKKRVGSFQIETPTTVASVKGTQFLVMVEENGETAVMTFEGLVEMLNPDGTGSEVGADQTGMADGSGEIVVKEFTEEDVPENILEEINEYAEKKEIRFKVEKDGTEKEVIIELN